jgi:hypothetical protein
MVEEAENPVFGAHFVSVAGGHVDFLRFLG